VGTLITRLATPPGRLFHAVCAVLALRLVWMHSQANYNVDDAALPRLLLFVCAVVWLARLIATLRRDERLSRWRAIAPLGGLLVGLLMATT
jgi:hypothetical protein